MSLRDFSRYLKKGNDIFEEFWGRGLTRYQACTLCELYENGGEAQRERLKEAAGVSDNSQFSDTVLRKLIEKGYMQRGKKGKDGRVKYSILPGGSNLVKEVMRETGYLSGESNQAVKPS